MATDSIPDPEAITDDEPVVVVAVVLYNSAVLLADFVASLAAGLSGVRWRLIAADNASTDGSVAELRRLAPDATIVELDENRGYAAGINAAVAAADAFDAVLVLNPDVRLGPGCVATLFTGLDSKTGIAVPKLLDRRGVLVPSMRRRPTVLRGLADAIVGATRAGRLPAAFGEVVTDERRYTARITTDWAEGSTQLISADCWHRCGPWDERFFLYSEETEFDLRAGDNGLATLFVPDAVAVHLEGDSAASPELWSLLVLNRIRLYRQRHGRAATVVYWSTVLLRESTRAVLGSRTSRAAVTALVSASRIREDPRARLVSAAPADGGGSPRVRIRPIDGADVPAVARFLRDHLNRRVPEKSWTTAMRSSWQTSAPNHGFLAESSGRIVGAYVAYYRNRPIDGRTHAVCNLGAWCVLEAYRFHSVRLLKALLAQPGYDFVDLSPSGNVIALNRRVGFEDVDTATAVIPNLPGSTHRGRVRVSTDRDVIRRALSPTELQIFTDHADAAAARHALIEHGDEHCYVIYRRDRRKRLPLFASVLYVGNAPLFQRAIRAFGARMLLDGVLVTLAETRVVGGRPRRSRMLKTPRPKMFKSATLSADAIDNLYSELVALPW